MKRLPTLVALCAGLWSVAQAEPFTYQGRLSLNGAPANGLFDFVFVLRDAATNQIGATDQQAPVTVNDGVFSVSLDFGPGVFAGGARWLEIAVRTNGSAASHTLLLPRQQIATAPYAMHAQTASNIVGAVSEALLPGNMARLNGNQSFTGTTTFNPLFGAPFVIGSMNTNRVAWLNADLLDGNDSGAFARSNHTHSALDITSGTLSDARLSANVPLLSDHQTFSGSNQFTGVLVATNPANQFAGNFVGNGGSLTSLNASALSGVIPQTSVPASVAQLGSNQTFTGTATFSPAGGAPFRVASSALVTNLNADQLDGVSASAFWNIGGNSNAAGTAFLGTIDNSPMEFRVNGTRGMRLLPGASAANFVAGSAGNAAVGAISGAGIVGGFNNSVSNNYAFIGGGSGNSVGANSASVLGGDNNRATGQRSVVAGGNANLAAGANSLAAGQSAQALHSGTLVWGDSFTLNTFTSTAPNQVLFRATGGVGIGTNNPQAALHVVGAVEANGLKLNASPQAGAVLVSDAAGNAAWQPPAVRAFTNATSPNVVAGHANNGVAAGVVGASIGGGGNVTSSNHIAANYGTIGGGLSNRVLGANGTIAGGSGNSAGANAGVAGGVQNVAGDTAAVSGGRLNTASGLAAFIGGGSTNTASGAEAVVAGGAFNTSSGARAFVGGGSANLGSGSRATIGGGENNRATNSFSTVGGGLFNTNSGFAATIGGGQNNFATNTGATIPGGSGNVAAGANSFAAGQGARAMHDGSFVWADSITASPFGSTAANQFLIRASGGVGIGGVPQDALLDVEGNTRLNDNDLFLRLGTDRNHGLGWYGNGKLFASAAVDGPVLYGFNGGALGSGVAGSQSIALRWNNANNVGIGTLSPAARLHVSLASGAGDTPQLTIEQTSVDNYSRLRFLNTGKSRWDLGVGGASNRLVAYSADFGEVMTLTPQGQMGIGGTPGNPLTVQGYGTQFGGRPGQNEVVGAFMNFSGEDTAISIASHPFALLDSVLYFAIGNDAVWGLRNARGSGNQFQLRNEQSGATHMTVTTSGSVGLGTTSPTDRLTVANGLRVDANDENSGSRVNGLRFGGDTTGEAIGSQRTPGVGRWGLDFYAGNANRMHIANWGGVGINTRDPQATLDVQGSVRFGVGGTEINRLQTGTTNVGSSGGGSKTITITFPTPFSGTPKILLSARGCDCPDTFVTTARAAGTTSFKVNVVRVDAPGSGWGQDLQVDWMAWE
jgi:hypothetical protein